MTKTRIKNSHRVESSGSALPAWLIVFLRELADLWIGGKALYIILIYTILLGILTYVLATNKELNLIPAKEMVFETLKHVIAVGGFIGLIIGSDSLSGERERGTLEALLLTPASRLQIMVGKFLAAFSAWPAVMAITIPYLAVLAQGDKVFGQALFWGGLLGTLLVAGFTGLGMFVSFWSNTNRNSFFVSLAIFLVLFLPTQWAATVQKGFAGQFAKRIDPLEAAYQFLAKILVNNRTLSEFWTWLSAPVLFAAIILGLLFLYAGPGLRLEGGRANRFWSYRRSVVVLFVIACLIFSLGAFPGLAQERASTVAEQSPLKVTIDLDYKVVRAGDPVEYHTVVTNSDTGESLPLVVAMNIINLNAEGDVVDPEDWSPQRTQYIESIPSGQSTTLSWRVNAILDGDYLVYMVVIPEPDGEQATSQPIASSGIHLTVTPFSRLNPGGVLPIAIGGPVILLVAVFVVYRLRRRQIDTGAK